MTAADDTSRRLARMEEQIRQLTSQLANLAEPAMSAPRQQHLERLPEIDAPATGEPEFEISGRGRLGGGPVAIRQRARMPDVLDTDPDAVAKVFAALASPARVTVLRTLLDGPRTSQQLRAELDDASVGQLYHHLRELLAAGLIIQPARSRYAIQRGAVVMVCAQLIAAGRLASRIPLAALADQEPPAGESEAGDAAPR